MSQVVTVEVRKNIAIVRIDSPPVNAISRAVREGVIEAMQEVDGDDRVEGVVLTCAGRTFIAGADISEFGKVIPGPNLWEMLASIEGSSKLVVAAIHGTALGGGLETAMHCNYRIALGSARIGLPEVHLGLLPGAGGTQLLPRLVGVQGAIDAMLSGGMIAAPKAAEMGAIDRIAEDDLEASAIAYVEELLESGAEQKRARDIVIDPASIPEGFFDQVRASIARKTRGYFAPEQIIQCIEASVNMDYDTARAFERKRFEECMASSESAGQRHIFFAERTASKIPDLPKDISLRKIERVAVIGAGTMGGGIAMNFASKGIPVHVVDLDEAAIERGLKVVRSNYARGIKKGRITQEQLEDLMKLFIPTTDYSELGDVDLVIEAVFENMALKKKIFARLDEVCKPGAILATNTSTLDVNEIAEATSRPEDVLGMHFFSPANIMKLLEIVRADKTAPDALATVMKLSKTIGKVGVVSGVCYGFIGNRMLEGYRREANLMLLEGASVEQIDKAMYDFGMPMGPFAMADLAGVDVGVKIRRERKLAGTLIDDPRDGVISELLVDMGRHGQKTGAGFYRYEEGSRQGTPDPEVEQLARREAARLGIEQREIMDEEIVNRCVYPMINTGAKILAEGIAIRASDIDVVWVYGYGFPPYRGGPMLYADTVGLKNVYETMCDYRDRPGNEFGYWEPATLLKSLAKSGGSFNGD
ncbi:MAG TPA: 3-hydroxyacyl-CoA dehydrogenase NAD-binding domain-containing protein [Xanthomonadales bacterium]|nr:3-hydroxyacyl-CoA dehydrogenase NAD-binding domain-containing protein [Xanthomonadales bacterium]